MTDIDLLYAERDAVALLAARLSNSAGYAALRDLLIGAGSQQKDRLDLHWVLVNRAAVLPVEYAGSALPGGWDGDYLTEAAAGLADEVGQAGLTRLPIGLRGAFQNWTSRDDEALRQRELPGRNGTGLTGALGEDLPRSLFSLTSSRAERDHENALLAAVHHLAETAATSRRRRWLDALVEVTVAMLTEVAARIGQDPVLVLRTWALRNG